jgi:hypothetical protein
MNKLGEEKRKAPIGIHHEPCREPFELSSNTERVAFCPKCNAKVKIEMEEYPHRKVGELRLRGSIRFKCARSPYGKRFRGKR